MTSPSVLPFRLGLQQRVLPGYRLPFFDTLARSCQGGLGVFAGQPRPAEMIESGPGLQTARYFPAANHHLLSGSLYLCWQAGLLAWLENWQPDVLIVEANPRYLSTSAGVRWMHAHRRPVIGWGLGVPAASGALAGLRRSARRAFLRQFDALLVYSAQGAAQYAGLGLNPDRIFVAPNAMAPRPTNPVPPRPPAPGGRPVVLFVGRLQARKRIDLLLQACARLPAAVQPALWVVGGGPEQPGLEALAKSVYPAAQFFGPRFGPDLDQLFSQADLFVLPGTGGLAVQQAMSFGLPVIVAEGDGTQSDLVRPGNGWSVAPGSLESLTVCLEAALADFPGLRRMGLESYRIVAEEVNVEAMVAAFGRAVTAVCQGRG